MRPPRSEIRRVSSRYRITIAFNRKYSEIDDLEGIKQRVSVGINALSKRNELLKIVSNPKDPKQIVDPMLIDGIIGSYVYEVSYKNSYPHWHFNIQVNHSTFIHMTKAKIKKYIKNFILPGDDTKEGDNLIYVHIKLVPADMSGTYFTKTLNFPESTNKLVTEECKHRGFGRNDFIVFEIK